MISIYTEVCASTGACRRVLCLCTYIHHTCVYVYTSIYTSMRLQFYCRDADAGWGECLIALLQSSCRLCLQWGITQWQARRLRWRSSIRLRWKWWICMKRYGEKSTFSSVSIILMLFASMSLSIPLQISSWSWSMYRVRRNLGPDVWR